MLRQGGCGQEKDLQFFATCPIDLSQLSKSVGLVHIFGQPARPEVVDKRPILGHVGHSPHGYCALTGLTKPLFIMQSCAAVLGSTVLVVAIVAMVAKYHGGQIIVLSAPCTWTVIQWRHGPSKKGSFTPTKGPLQTKSTTGDPIGHSCGLVCLTRQPLVHFGNLAKLCRSFELSFPQL